MAFDMFDKLKEKAEGAKGAVLEAGIESLKESMNDLDAFLGTIKDAGYDLVRMEIALAVSPTVQLFFKTAGEIDQKKLDALVKASADKKLVSAVVLALVQANKIRCATHVGKLSVVEVAVTLSVPPTVGIKFE